MVFSEEGGWGQCLCKCISMQCDCVKVAGDCKLLSVPPTTWTDFIFINVLEFYSDRDHYRVKNRRQFHDSILSGMWKWPKWDLENTIH